MTKEIDSEPFGFVRNVDDFSVMSISKTPMCDVGVDKPLYAAPPAPVAVPDEQHSERFDWSYEDWANHLGGRHQNNDPARYYEFGSFMAVAEMLRQFGNVQRKVGWNACRAAMQVEPVMASTVQEIENLEHFIAFWRKVQSGAISPSKNEIDHTVWFLESLAAPGQQEVED